MFVPQQQLPAPGTPPAPSMNSPERVVANTQPPTEPQGMGRSIVNKVTGMFK